VANLLTRISDSGEIDQEGDGFRWDCWLGIISKLESSPDNGLKEGSNRRWVVFFQRPIHFGGCGFHRACVEDRAIAGGGYGWAIGAMGSSSSTNRVDSSNSFGLTLRGGGLRLFMANLLTCAIIVGGGGVLKVAVDGGLRFWTMVFWGLTEKGKWSTGGPFPCLFYRRVVPLYGLVQVVF